MPSSFLSGYDAVAVNCTPSRQALIGRLEKALRNNQTPYSLLELFNEGEKSHLLSNLISGDQQKAYCTWLVVSNGSPLPLQVQQALYKKQADQTQRVVQKQQEQLRVAWEKQVAFQKQMMRQQQAAIQQYQANLARMQKAAPTVPVNGGKAAAVKKPPVARSR